MKVEKHFGINREVAQKMIDATANMTHERSGDNGFQKTRVYLFDEHVVLKMQNMNYRNVTTEDMDFKHLERLAVTLLDLQAKGVNVVPILAFQSDNGNGYIIQPRAKGAELYERDRMTDKDYVLHRVESLSKAPQEHFDKFVSDIIQIISTGVLVDFAGKDNFFYDDVVGFQFIDLNAHDDYEYGLSNDKPDAKQVASYGCFVPCYYDTMPQYRDTVSKLMTELTDEECAVLKAHNKSIFEKCKSALINNGISEEAVSNILSDEQFISQTQKGELNSIIKTHEITLYGSSSDFDIVLRPLCDYHLPLLYKWSADPDVLYWTESGVGTDNEQSYDAETVHSIYGGVSQNALCFLIEVNDVSIGECWLQKMNLDNVKAMYPDSADVRRIDMAIGEKTMWGKGIGTAFIRMLVDYAFSGEYVEVLHCLCDDYNIRSRRVFEKNGFKLILSEELPQQQKGKLEHHFRLTRQEYIESRRVKVSSDKIFELPITEIQPSQLYISEGKLRLVRDWFNPADKANFDPIPVKLYKGRYLMTDGHTRVAMAILAGWETVPVTWDDDPLDMLAYALDVMWCDEEGIKNAADLSERIVPHNDYIELWHKRCHYMEIPPSYAAIVARFGGLDGRHKVVILTDNTMLETAQLIQSESAAFVKEAKIINLDETSDYKIIYSLSPDDLLILHIGIDSWRGRHNNMTYAFNKPEGVAAKYICIRPTITAQALLDGLNTPYEITESVLTKYEGLPSDKNIRVISESGTDISFVASDHWTIPFTTHEPGANACLPPAEISYDITLGSANGVIVVDVTVGELRVNADLIDEFGLIDEPVSLQIQNGVITDIHGGDMAKNLKAHLWNLPESCRKIVEFGIGLSRMEHCGIIGIDESIAGTCHFGFGSGSGNDAPIHLDVVISKFTVV